MSHVYCIQRWRVAKTTKVCFEHEKYKIRFLRTRGKFFGAIFDRS